jgi:diacylglycerol O-acyltransferase / wax synthase
MGNGTRLTALEASFLAMEGPELPLHVGALLTIDANEPISMPELRRLVVSRLRHLPKFRQRVTFSPLALGRPEWTRTSRLNLDSHLFEHRLAPPGRISQLLALCAHIHEAPLARNRPLWEMHLIQGIEGDEQALLIKTHHAVTDGIAGVGLAQILFDRAPAIKRHVDLPPTRFADCANMWTSPLSILRGFVGLGLTVARGPMVRSGPFNGAVGPHREFAVATLRMDAILRAKRQIGGSVDDVLLALVAAGLHRYLGELRYPEKPRALRAMIPVSTRSASGAATFGNHVTAIFVDLPTDSADVPRLVRQIAAWKAILRTEHAAEGASMAIEAVGMLPNPVHEAVLRLVSRVPFAHLILSDVRGLDEPLFLLGRKIAACYPMMPLAQAVGLSIAAVSMDELMGVGISSDPGLVPEPQRLARAIEWALDGYERSYGLGELRPAA